MFERGTKGEIDDDEQGERTYHNIMLIIEKVGAVTWV
jgi:hypothetical protein